MYNKFSLAWPFLFMIFKENKIIEKIGKNTGYLFSFFSLTTITYYILVFIYELQTQYLYYKIMILIFSLFLIGEEIRRKLK